MALFWALGILLPGLVLAGLALRAADREEAYLQVQLEQTLSLRIDERLDALRSGWQRFSDSLQAGFPELQSQGSAALVRELEGWAASQGAVRVAFLFATLGRFHLPEERSANLRPEEREFLRINREFFQDIRPAEVFQAKEPLLEQSFGKSKGQISAKRFPYRSQKAEEPELALSFSASLRFSQLIADSTEGFIRRQVDNEFVILYWRKVAPSLVAGCWIETNALHAALMPGLDGGQKEEHHFALGLPDGRLLPDKGRPLAQAIVAKEVGPMLPRYEVAAFLDDPGAWAQRKRARRWLTLALAIFFAMTMLVGAVLVYRNMAQELLLAEKKTTFVSNVSHELKTPLTSIRLFAEILREGRERDEAQRKRFLDSIVSESERLGRLIANVLDFSRAARGETRYRKQDTDLSELTRTVVESNRARLESLGFSLQALLPDGPVMACTDPEALHQCLLNLLSNAEKYSPELKEIEVQLSREAGDVVWVVSDRGQGIGPRDRERIFQEFVRLDDSLTNRSQGAGLGLAITRRILRDLGGRIQCRGREGGGSVFEMRLCLNTKETADES